MQRFLAAVVHLVIVGFLGFLLIGGGSTAFARDNESPPRGVVRPQSATTPNSGGSPSQYGQQNQPNPNDNRWTDQKKIDDFCSGGPVKKTPEQIEECRMRLATGGSTTGDSCTQRSADLTAAKKDFDKACGKANMSMSGGSCLAQVKKCQGCIGGGDEGEECGDPDIDTSDISSSVASDEIEKLRSNVSNGGGYGSLFQQHLKVVPDLAKVKLKYQNCPAMAGADYKSLQKEVEEGQKKVDELELKIPKIQQEMSDMRTKIDEGVAKTKDKLNEAKNEWQQKRDDIDAKFFKDQEGLQTQVQKIRNDIDTKRDSITNLVLSKSTKKMERDQQLSALRLKCNEIALTQIQQMRALKASQVSKAQFTGGNFTQLMARAGLSEREQYQNKAEELYNNCLQSNIFTEGKKTIDDSYKNAITIIDTEITKFNREIEKGQAEMDRIMEAFPKQMKLEYDRASQRADDDYKSKEESAILQQQLLEREMNQRIQLKYKELEQAMNQLSREKDYLQQKQKFLALKRQYTDGDMDGKSGDISEAIALYDSLVGTANQVWSQCGCETNPTKGECATASSYNGKKGTEKESPVKATAPATGDK